jgi:hypothetical protein
MEPNSVFATTGTLTATPGTLNYHTTINPNWYDGNTIISGGSSTSITFNTNNMNKQQVKVAVFRVTRDEFGNIESSEFLEEMWIEQTPGKSIDFAVAKQLEEDVEADEIVIKQLQSVTL